MPVRWNLPETKLKTFIRVWNSLETSSQFHNSRNLHQGRSEVGQATKSRAGRYLSKRHGYQADYAIDSILLKNGVVWYHMLSLSDLLHNFKLIKAEVEEIKEKVEAEEIKEEKAEVEEIKDEVELGVIATPKIEEVLPVLNDQGKDIFDRLRSEDYFGQNSL